MMNEIFEISGIEELRVYLAGIPDNEALREQLYEWLLKYTQYRDAAEWNLAVRDRSEKIAWRVFDTCNGAGCQAPWA